MNNKTAQLDEELRSVDTEIKALESSRPALEDALLISLKEDIAEVFLTAFGVDFSETKTITTKTGQKRSVKRSFNEKKDSLEGFLKRLDEPSVKDALVEFVASTEASTEVSEESSKKPEEGSDEASTEASENQEEGSDEASTEALESTPEEPQSDPQWGSDAGNDQDGIYVPQTY